MKRNRLLLLLVIVCLACLATLILSACKPTPIEPVEYTITFMVDGSVYKTVSTAGNITIAMPTNPTKNGYTFDGWYTDEGVWQSKFTASSLSYAALTSDLTVYAKFTATSTVDPKPEPPELTYEWQTTVDATCTTAGIEERINPDTNQKESREIIPLGHVYGEFVTTRDPSCTVEGSKSKTCFRCRDVITESIPVVDHISGDWVITEQPTCSTMGKQVKECEVCKAELESKLIITDHIFDADDACVYCGCSNLLYDYYGVVSGFANTNIEHISLVIPQYYNGKSVTSIGSFAFKDCSSLASVTIPNSVISIGKMAFCGCSSLTSVTISNSVTSIGSLAFSNCGSLQYNEYDNALYLGNTTNPYVVLVKSSNTSITSCAIHENAKAILSSAFESCGALASVTIPNSVTSIGEEAFRACNNLASVNYLGTIESWRKIQGLDNLMRYGTSSKTFSLNGEPVTELVIPDTFTSIPSYAFASTNITRVTIPSNVTSIDRYAFEDCRLLASITIPCSVTRIGEGAFENCNNIKNAVIPSLAIGYIPKISLQTVVITSGDSIDDSAFRGCSSLTSVTIPSSVTRIGKGAFENCSSLTIYSEMISKPESWNSNWNSSCPVVWDCNSNDKDENGYEYALIDRIRYSLKDNVATVIRQPHNITKANIPQTVTYKGVDYAVTSIASGAFA